MLGVRGQSPKQLLHPPQRLHGNIERIDVARFAFNLSTAAIGKVRKSKEMGLKCVTYHEFDTNGTLNDTSLDTAHINVKMHEVHLLQEQQPGLLATAVSRRRARAVDISHLQHYWLENLLPFLDDKMVFAVALAWLRLRIQASL